MTERIADDAARRTPWQQLLALGSEGANASLVVLLLALVGGFALVVGDALFTSTALQSMAFQMPELGILSLAMMITLLSGGINLSIISTANLCALTMAFVMTRFIPGSEGAAWVFWQVAALVAGFAVATVIGLVNGYIIAYLGVSPILTTLGTMTLVKGIAIGLTRGNVLSGFPDPIVFIGNGTIWGVPFAMVVFAAVAIPMAVMLGRTPLGAAIYMIGSNERATRFSGIDTRRVILEVYLHLQPAGGRRRGGDDGALQFRQRILRRELPARDHPRRRARRHRPHGRVRQGHGAEYCRSSSSR